MEKCLANLPLQRIYVSGHELLMIQGTLLKFPSSWSTEVSALTQITLDPNTFSLVKYIWTHMRINKLVNLFNRTPDTIIKLKFTLSYFTYPMNEADWSLLYWFCNQLLSAHNHSKGQFVAHYYFKGSWCEVMQCSAKEGWAGNGKYQGFVRLGVKKLPCRLGP